MLVFDVEQDATATVRAPAEFRIRGELDTDNKARLILDQSISGLKASQSFNHVAGVDGDCAHDGAGPDGDHAGKTVVHLGTQNVVQANIYAPNGSLWIKAGTHATGAFVARRVRIGEKVELSLANSLR